MTDNRQRTRVMGETRYDEAERRRWTPRRAYQRTSPHCYDQMIACHLGTLRADERSNFPT